MRGMLGFLILFLLSKKPMHGQEIAEEIARRKGGEKDLLAAMMKKKARQ
jgi:PadR family transcriptional regulator, regulatory protein PadR